MDLITIEAQSERAVLVPEAGCQCLSYRVGTLDVIAGPSDPDAWRAHPHRGGIPILFPWPGRVAGAQFAYRGAKYQLPVNESHGHSIHGFACERSFKVLRHGPHFMTAMLDSADDSSIAKIWPWPFQFEIDYEIGNGLRLKATVRNTGTAPMPFGFGAHPYFHAPLSPQGQRAAMRLKLAAVSHWPLNDKLIPDGSPEPLTGKLDLSTGPLIGDETYDDAFVMAPYKKDEARARLVDTAMRAAVEIRAEPIFGDFVVYVPAGEAVAAIEPYTCAPDAFNLAARGVESGMLELWPGESWSGGFEIRISAP